MRLRSSIGVLFGLWLLAFARAVSAATGDPRVAQYFVADPIGGSTAPAATLNALVAGEKHALSGIDPKAATAAQGWANGKTHVQLIEVAVALSRVLPKPALNARATVTSGCGSYGGSATALKTVTGVPNSYEVSCRSLLKSTTPPVEFLAFVKKNTLVLFIAKNGPAFSLNALNKLAATQYAAIPGNGIAT
jgi:hypothetical protein